MGYDLRNELGHEMGFNMSAFCNLLFLAEQYGWKPAGTRAPAHFDLDTWRRPWDGNYTSNDDQVVTNSDALAMAEALERAIPDIEKSDKGFPYCVYYFKDQYNGAKAIREFIKFAKEGWFTIG